MKSRTHIEQGPHLAAWLFGGLVAVMTVGALAAMSTVDVGAEILLAVVAAVATL